MCPEACLIGLFKPQCPQPVPLLRFLDKWLLKFIKSYDVFGKRHYGCEITFNVHSSGILVLAYLGLMWETGSWPADSTPKHPASSLATDYSVVICRL